MITDGIKNEKPKNPPLFSVKNPVKTLEELYALYPNGAEYGDYALVVSEGVIYYYDEGWHPVRRDSAPMTIGYDKDYLKLYITESISGKIVKTFISERILPADVGEYSMGLPYNYLDMVTYNGSTYISYKSQNTTPPSEDSGDWRLIAKGADLDHFYDLLNEKQDNIEDLETIRGNAELGASAYQKPSSGIPSTDLERDVQLALVRANNALQLESFRGTVTGIKVGSVTKMPNEEGVVNFGTFKTINNQSILGEGNIEIQGGEGGENGGYSKVEVDNKLAYKQDNIPDLEAIRSGASKGATALQSYTEQYKGTVTGVKINGSTKSPSSGTVDIGNVVTSVKINGSSKTPSSGVIDLGTVITSHQDISGKQDKLVSGSNIKTINGTSILGSGDITISGGSGGGNKNLIDTASGSTSTTPKLLINVTTYGSKTPYAIGLVNGDLFTIDFTTNNISASSAGYPFYLNLGGTHLLCKTSEGINMTKTNFPILKGYYTFMLINGELILMNERVSSEINTALINIINQ